MMKVLRSFKNLTKVYHIVFLLYFSFFLANGGMEYNIPFIFDARGISGSGYGMFLSILNLLEVLLPLTIVFLIKRYSPVAVNVFFLAVSILSAFLIVFTKNNSILFVGLLMLCAMRIIFNFSIGNEVNLTIPAGIRGEYFAIRDLFLYGAIAISTFLSSRIIAKSRMENVYLLLSLALVITMVCSFKLKKKFAPQEEEAAEKIKWKTYFEQMRSIFKNKTFIALLIIQIASIMYSVSLKFVPLLALKRGVSVAVFLQYTGVFTIINCVGSLILAYSVKGASKKKIYLLDLAFDVFSALLFVFSRQSPIF